MADAKMRPGMITAASLRSSVSTAWVPLSLLILMLGLEALGAPARNALSLDRAAIGAGQWWRLITGHFVHLGLYHLMLNALGLLALVVLCPQKLRAVEWLRRLFCLSLFTGTALYLGAPAVQNYVGLSGVLHGLFLLGLVPMARQDDRIAIACLVYLAGKLAWEQVMGTPLSDEQAIGGAVVTLAHLFGTLAALVYGFAFGTFRRGETPQ
jgi:rhomboid family GlyGly-CTERM serine protease